MPTGLYAFGKPDKQSEVIITGNYKLTFDYLRKYLKKDYWVLVIDSDGINVWCSAGKGRFGTAEVIRMLQTVELPVDHNRVILPQLSGPGVQSHLVSKITKKKVIFGPVRIQDMDDFVEGGIKSDMRLVTFNLKDRMTLVPIEIIFNLKVLAFTFLVSLVPIVPMILFWISLSAVVLGSIIFPALLPIMPFRMFYKNGMLLALPLLLFLSTGVNATNAGLVMLGMLYTSFLAMSFTGSTTFTSLSGVKKELEQAIPIMVWMLLIAVLTTLIGMIKVML